MPTTELAALLQAAPESHSRRCALALHATESRRWPAAVCELRTASAAAEDWAQRARALADWCDAQTESGRAYSAVPVPMPADCQATALLPVGAPTLESLEAGLMALAHSLGREHALRVRRAMNGVLSAQQRDTAAPAGAAA
ncbi:hypothetical protein [Paracidovorax konjaci]|uniref:Uncharacterized protein n=1 Tax=Paracidovorax konjaci TaxID=32040 RepID=A0A1I1YJ08_9BURK|nr:hypothetical protein [Paracidovorax konjaci]SFE19481.1 hypothetical protein SAMN04489710_11838 [Paracidovorax konjaci]